ncbi:MAG: thioredoxin domain-containing protein [Patescibacteria group bacterium]
MEQEIKNSKNYLVPASIIVAAFLIAGAFFVSKNPSVSQIKSTKSDTKKNQVAKGDRANSNKVNINFEGWPAMGDPSASVVMVEYSDFACPFCNRFSQETLPSVKKDYIDKGKILFVYKDFTVVGGERAAEAAHCAQEQGKFWEYHDKLFSKSAQDKSQWANSEVHRGYARDLGLDEDAFLKCFEERRYEEMVALSNQEAAQNGGEGTPYFLINGKSIFGAQPYSAFQIAIDSALNERQ